MNLRLMVSAALMPLCIASLAKAETSPALAAVAAVVPAFDGIHGRVVSTEGTPLPGAEIRVQGTGRRAVSNTQGEFTLPGLSGQIVLNVRYLGLPTHNQSVAVTPGRSTYVTLSLGGEVATTLSDVVVTGVITDGVARSLNQQKNADGTINVLSADAIGRYPDPNVAESLQRVPGIAIQRDQGEGRYINLRGAPSAFTAVSVDGVTVPAVSATTRAVDLDTLPSDIVSNIEIAKTLVPSQDADSIAGSVNIKTRSPFDKRRLAISGYAGGSYNDYGGEDIRAGVTASNVFGEDQTFGGLISLSYSRTNRRPDNVENAWVKVEQDGRDVLVLEETLFKDYETERTRQSINGALEWRPSQDFKVWLRGAYAQFEDDEYRDSLVFGYADGKLEPGATNQSARYTGARIYRQMRHRTQNNEISTLSLGAEHQFENGAVWDASVSWARSEQTYPHRDELVYRSGSVALSYDMTNHYQPTYSAFDEATGYYRDPTKFSFRENTFRENTSLQEDLSFATNVELPTTLGGHDVAWKFGAKHVTRDITADEERFRDRASSASPGGLADQLSQTSSRNYDYDLGFKFNHDLVADYLNRAAANGSKSEAARRMPQSISADYTASEDISSAYGQARFDLGDTNVLIGLRVENTRFEGQALAVDEDTGATTTRHAKIDQTDVFPNLTLRHSFSPDLIGRFALTRAISRPEYTDIVPRALETTDSGRVTATVGNPDLKPTLANNIDLGLEYYLKPLGVISANAFYKDLSDYRYELTVDGTYNGLPAQLTRVENAPEGHIAGIEFNWQQTFDFLPGWASGFGIFANATFTEAEIKLGRTYGGRDTFALPGQSDTTYNVALFYEKAGFSARLSYTHRGDYLETINANDGDLDLWVEGREQLDLTASYDFGNGIEIFGEAKNLTDSAGIRYYGVRERTYEYEKFGYNLFAGVRFKL